MGCDIHMFTERKRSIDGLERWTNIDHFKINPHYGYSTHESKLEIIKFYGSRNYRLFSILADVRNYHNNKVIAAPKGFPNDCSQYVNEQNENWGIDAHSHSYFTLKELKEFSVNNSVVKYAGKMTPKDAALVDAGKMPDSWCQGTNIESYVYREWEFKDETMIELVDNLEKRTRAEFWMDDDEDTSQHDDNIRIVFWFDN